MAKDKIEHALVTQPTYINGVLHMPGEIAAANLTELGVDKIGGTRKVKGKDDAGNAVEFEIEQTPGLAPVPKNAAEPIDQVEVAAVAPHAPEPTMPQGLPPGTVQSGTGRHISQDPDGPSQMVAPGAQTISDKAKVADVQPVIDAQAATAAPTPARPTKPTK